MIKLTQEEKEFIEQKEREVEVMIQRLEAIRAFKLDDFLVAFIRNEPRHHHRMVMPVQPPQPWLNSYGLHKKFKVVVVDKNGVPYIKELNKNGKPYGRLICAVPIGEDYDNIIFQVDPDYEDSLILGEQPENFEATAAHKVKASVFKDITTHNKQNRVKPSDMQELVNYVNSLVVGSVIWRSSRNAWTVTKINPIPRDQANRIKNNESFMEVQDSKGRMINVAFWDLKNKVIYRDRPRSYKELNNT